MKPIDANVCSLARAIPEKPAYFVGVRHVVERVCPVCGDHYTRVINQKQIGGEDGY